MKNFIQVTEFGTGTPWLIHVKHIVEVYVHSDGDVRIETSNNNGAVTETYEQVKTLIEEAQL